MRRRLSSRWTLFHKLTLPVIWVLNAVWLFAAIVAGLLDAGPARHDLIGLAPFSVFWIFFGVLIYIWRLPLKAAFVDDENLYVSNYCKTVRVPLAEVEGVAECRWNQGVVKIAFKGPTAFGKSIIVAPWSWSPPTLLWPPSEWFKRKVHPAVKQLRAAVARAQWLALADAHAPETIDRSPTVKLAPKARRSRSPRTDISSQGPGDVRKEDGKHG